MEPSPKAIRVLLVDDDEDDYLIIRNLLARPTRTAFKLEWEANPDLAEAAIAEERHDVYLIDYRLGPVSGLELLTSFDLIQRPQPFIILTGAGDEAVEQAAMRMGVADYLVKGTFGTELLARVMRYSLQRKRSEAQRIEQLITINKSKDEFIALASHQLRTPATAVKQYVGMVLQGYAGDISVQQRSFLDKAYENNERQINTVNDILRVAQIDLDKMTVRQQPTDIVPLLEAIIQDAHQKTVEREQTVSLEAPDHPVMAAIDAEYIRMALGNLLDNASKYTPRGKHISIKTGGSRGGIVKVSIHDQGVGIAAADLDKLFKKFSRIPNPLSIEVGGTGLGLYWSREVVRLHGGDIDVQSAEGEGSTFTMTVPAA